MPVKKKTSALNPSTSVNLKIGAKVPDFNLESTESEKFKLSQHKGKNILLFFYPKDATPGCTLEAHEFSQKLNEFKKLNTVVYGVSRDSLKSHEKFREKQCYTVHLLSDPDEVACKIFSVIKLKKLYGREYMGVDRSTFLIDESGKLQAQWRGVKVQGHVQEVLDWLKTK